MIVISTHNKHTNRQRLAVVRNWKDALAWAERVGVESHIPHGVTLEKFVHGIVQQLNSPEHTVTVAEHPETHDLWDVAKVMRPALPPKPEPLAKSVSPASDEDEKIRDEIIAQMGGSKRHAELKSLANLAERLPSLALRKPSNTPMADMVSEIRAQAPEAAGATDQDIANLISHGFERHPGSIASTLYVPKFREKVRHHINTSDVSEGDTSWDDLLLDYKGQPHSFFSALAKYAVNRLVRKAQYATPEGAQQEDLKFMATGAKDMHPAMLQRIHAALLSNPDILSDALRNQREHEQFITRNFPESVRTIDGVPHVAVSRALTVPHHGEDYAISSYADVPNNSLFGSNTFRYWVPMNHVWNHYDLHRVGMTSSYGSEDEVLVDKWHPRILASESEVRHIVPRGLFSTQFEVPSAKRIVHKAMTNQSLDDLPGDDVRSVLHETHEYNIHKMDRDTISRLFGAKNLTGDHILSLATMQAPQHMPMFDYEDVWNNSKLTDDHRRAFAAHAMGQYTESISHPGTIRDVASVLAHTPHLLTDEQKSQFASDVLKAPAQTLTHPHLTDREKLILEPSHIALAKLFVKNVPDADKYLRMHGSSAEEVSNRHLPDIAYTGANRISKFLKG